MKAHLERSLKKLAGLGDDEEIIPEGVEPGESGGFIVPDFKKDIRDTINKRLIDQAAYIVYREQTVSKFIICTRYSTDLTFRTLIRIN